METAYWCFDRFGEPDDVLALERQTLPPLRRGQALVKVKAIGLNRSDGHFPPDTLPSCSGHEAVGEVVLLGPPDGETAPLRQLKVGDRVATLPMAVDMLRMGALRQHGLYDQRMLLPVPERFDDVEGAAYWLGVLTMAGAMQLAGLVPGAAEGKSVVITAAAGGMGTLGLQLARAWGARTIATTRRSEKVEPLEACADVVLRVRNGEELRSALLETSGGQGVDVVLDPVGGDYLRGAIGALARGGRVVSYESVSGEPATIDVLELMSRDASLHGYTVLRPMSRPDLLDQLIDLGMSTASKVRPMVAEEFPFARAPAAFAALRRSKHVGKIVVRA